MYRIIILLLKKRFKLKENLYLKENIVYNI